MTTANHRGRMVVSIVGALFLVLVVVPAVLSVGDGNGKVCFTDSACPLAAINPCMRKPSFAVVGRCAIK